MVNETKTEGIIRRILGENREKYEQQTGKNIIIEEKQSDNPQIRKLLENASKSGSGTGYPEFIVSFANKDFVIVIECKAELTKHRSADLDKFSEYAVDGALLYSSYLSKEFDVISVGCSGENEQELQVSNFIQIKGEIAARDLNIEKIYDFQSYLDLLKKDQKKEKKDYDTLMEYSSRLNDNLRDNFEFEENSRPLIVSGILLALEDEGFLASYKKKQTPLEVANLVITTVKERLERDNIKGIKQSTIIDTYGFIRTNTAIIMEKTKDGKPNTQLKDLIADIEKNVKPFLEEHKEYDVIGAFYNEFLRYANGDGGLGIVLTPKHVTELFVELAEVNKDSVVIDNCCGTAGFLISAMKRMEDEAKGDQQKIHDIHMKQLIGIDNNPKMFCLACSNMMLRGDGKSNINQQNCFEIDEKYVESFKPNIGFLNPPYSKENGHKELRFIENCLGFLEPNGICIAIVPQSCAMNTKKGNLAVKQRLLQHHTLKAVMSTPDDIFADSDKQVITCILVFEANKPHGESTKTWFGYWKNDGYIYLRNKGRIDYYGRFENEIKKLWLDSYFNKKEIDGFSILKHVKADDEWLVEPYIKTCFESLTDANFEDTLREYSTFLYYNRLREEVTTESSSNSKLQLDFSTWQSIKLGWDKQSNPKGLFIVKGARKTDKKILDKENTLGQRQYPYVTTQCTNNGVRGWYDTYVNKGNILTVDSAWLGFCSYQPLDFTASDHVERLLPRFELDVFRALFLVTVINMEQYRYSYGRKFNQTRIRETIIKLPFRDNEIDWNFIENYVKGLNYSKSIILNPNYPVSFSRKTSHGKIVLEHS